jgi:hypothetical protein
VQADSVSGLLVPHCLVVRKDIGRGREWTDGELLGVVGVGCGALPFGTFVGNGVEAGGCPGGAGVLSWRHFEGGFG